MGTAFKPYLTRGLPATAHVVDRETARVLDALKDALRRLEQELQEVRAAKTPAATDVVESSLKLSAGKNITLSPMSGGYVISAVDQVQSAPAVSVDLNATDPGSDVVELGDDTEGAEAASSDSWDSGGSDGLSLWVQVRQGYYDSGDQKWYAYARNLIFDAAGRLFTVSAETRITVDVPEV